MRWRFLVGAFLLGGAGLADELAGLDLALRLGRFSIPIAAATSTGQERYHLRPCSIERARQF